MAFLTWIFIVAPTDLYVVDHIPRGDFSEMLHSAVFLCLTVIRWGARVLVFNIVCGV